MSNAHRNSILDMSNKCIPIDPVNTKLLCHYDITTEDCINGVVPTTDISTLTGLIQTSCKVSGTTSAAYQGKFGGAVYLNEPTTNLLSSVCNPYFTDNTGWSLVNDSNYLSNIEDNAESLYGGKVLKIVDNDGNTTTHEWGGISTARITGLSAGTVYTMTVRYKVTNWTTGYVAVWSHWQDTTAVNPSSPADFLLPSSNFDGYWHTTSFTTTCPTGYDSRTWSPGFDLTNLGCTYYIDVIQFEAKAFATSFVNVSRDIQEQIIYPTNLSGDFTISFWAAHSWASSNNISKERPRIGLSNGTNVLNFFGGWASDNYIGDETTKTKFTLSGYSFTAYQWINYVVKRSGTIITIYINGILHDTIDFTCSPAYTNLKLGGYSPVSQMTNILIDELRVDSIARTDEEILSWYISNRPFYPRERYKLVR